MTTTFTESDEKIQTIDPRIAARRRQVLSDRDRRIRRALLVIAVVATAAGLVYGTTRSALLNVDAVSVTGARQVKVDDVVAASLIHPGDQLIDLDLDAAAAGVRALPWVKTAVVTDGWRSGDVAIEMTERVPVAVIEAAPDGWALVDRERRVLSVVASRPPDLPAIDGIGLVAPGGFLEASAEASLTVAAALTPGLRSRVWVVRGSDPKEIELRVRPAGSVHFGRPEQLDEKIRSLQTVFSQVDLKCLAAIDVRVPDSPVLTRDPTCA